MAKRSLLLSLWILLLSVPAFSQAVVGIQPQSLSPSVVVVQSPSGAVFTTLNCNGSIGTSGQVLVGGNPCTWTGTPTLTSLTFTTGLSSFIADSVNTVALKRTTNFQTFRVYRTDDGAGNAEWLDIGFQSGLGSNLFSISANASGTGAPHAIVINPNSSSSYIELANNGADIFHITNTGLVDQGTHTITAGGAFVSSGTGLTVANVGANSCGTTAATIAGGNNAFAVTVGATSGSQCRVTFTLAAATEWDCSYTGNSAALTSPRVVPVDTTHTDFIATFGAGQTFIAVCFPR